MANRLADQTSPYLLQHKDNPVDWYPWGPEALGVARQQDKPILLSIGYSACHWCHVMAHESFEDAITAAYMNEHFVCIKVDREERPDIDAIYMEAAQAMTGHGGWPLTAFLTPDQVPFHVGTYFPPEPRQGMPSFRQLMEAVIETWTSQRADIERGAMAAAQRLGASATMKAPENPVDPGILVAARDAIGRAYDTVNGGFGTAPKFPQPSTVEFLLHSGEIDMSIATLRKMAAGGIYDQIGGGFARYAVDSIWLIPHFEKMLYDNALLARCYLHGWQVTGDAGLLRTCRETLDWMLLEMRGPEGGFYSAYDADSEGVEGKFYAWSFDELREVLGEDADELIFFWGASEGGNFEGKNVLHVVDISAEVDTAQLERGRARLYERRAQRVWPGLDDKRLTSWNALAVRAFAEAGAALNEPRYVDAASKCADFVLAELRDEHGRLLRTWKDGTAQLLGYLEDYAFMVEALIGLYEATFDARWYSEAVELADQMIDRFGDESGGGFFQTAHDHEDLVARRKDLEDNPIPSGNSAAAYGLLRLAALSGEARYEDAAERVLRLLQQPAGRFPNAFGHLLQAADFYLSPTREIALIGHELDELAAVVQGRFRPHIVLAGSTGRSDQVPLLAGRDEIDGQPAAYVCEQFKCQAPVTTAAQLRALLD